MREILGKYYGEWCVVKADFDRYSKTPEGSNVVCFRNVYIEGQWVTDHIWVHRSKVMKQAAMVTGDQVEFLARVDRYSIDIPRPHIQPIEYDYCLEKIREFAVVKRRERETNGQ